MPGQTYPGGAGTERQRPSPRPPLGGPAAAALASLCFLVSFIRVPWLTRWNSWLFCRACFAAVGRRPVLKAGVRIDCPERIQAGDDLNIGEYSFLVGNGGLAIGDRVLIGHHVSVLTTDHVFADPRRPIAAQGLVCMPVDIGDDVFIGCGARVVGASVGTGAVVGAGAVVTHDVEAFAVVGGVPARVIGRRAVGG